MRIATFNVNSLRARIDRVVALLEREQIDVLALQETKVADPKFPLQPLTDAGYQVARHGLDQWNGVAIVSRVGLTDVQIGLPGCPEFGDPAALEARAIGARCGGVEVWSLYIPNGREIDHPHYQYKMRWLRALRDMGAAKLAANPDDPIVLCGDYNVAPLDTDVWDIAAFEGKTHVTEPERAAFNDVVSAGFTDVVRPILPGKEGDSYWDYQQLRYQRKQGMRIDFLLGSAAVSDAVTHAYVDRAERKGKGASDHAPVIIEIDRAATAVSADVLAAEPLVEGRPAGGSTGPRPAAASGAAGSADAGRGAATTGDSAAHPAHSATATPTDTKTGNTKGEEPLW